MATFINAAQVLVAPAPTYKAADGLSTGAGTTMSFSHTIAADTNMVVLFIGARDGNDPTISGNVTYGGVTMTSLATAANGGTYMKTFVYYLLNPASGAQDVSVTFSEALQSSRLEIIDIGGAGSVQPDASDDDTTASGTSISPDVTSTGPALFLWGLHCAGTGSIDWAGSGDGTEIAIGETSGTGTSFLYAYLRVTDAGATKSHQGSTSAARAMSGIGVAIRG